MNPISAALARAISTWLTPGRPLIVGICGAQASGKSTACAELLTHFAQRGLVVGGMSLDDVYFGRGARQALAAETHPLFATRGPPGTHDAALGIATLEAVKAGTTVKLPRFSKRDDEPLPKADWPTLPAQCDLFLFEGWCVGAAPQPEEALCEPVNQLERDEDPDGSWRSAVNAHLAGETGQMFAMIDRLAYLRPPSFDVVHRWRCEQERVYIAGESGKATAAMTDDQIARFITHYQRLTCWMMEDMPGRADLTLDLNEAREVVV